MDLPSYRGDDDKKGLQPRLPNSRPMPELETRAPAVDLDTVGPNDLRLATKAQVSPGWESRIARRFVCLAIAVLAR